MSATPEKFARAPFPYTYGGAGTKDSEAIWFSPACLRPALARQPSLFADTEAA